MKLMQHVPLIMHKFDEIIDSCADTGEDKIWGLHELIDGINSKLPDKLHITDNQFMRVLYCQKKYKVFKHRGKNDGTKYIFMKEKRKR